MAGRPVAGLQLPGLGRLFLTDLHAVRAAVVEGAAAGGIGGAGHIPFQMDARLFLRRVPLGDGGEKGFGVGVEGVR